MPNVRFLIEDEAKFEDNPDLVRQADQLANLIQEALSPCGLKESHHRVVGQAIIAWLGGGSLAEGARIALGKLALTGSGEAARSEILRILGGLEVEPPRKRGRGRPLLSPTGERRQEWRISIAPSVREKAELEAAAEGVSASAWLEGLILGTPKNS